jgi:hypothetical protein
MKFIYSCIIFLFFIVFSFAQAPDTLWTKRYGGIDQDHGCYVQQTSDGGYILTGDTKSFGMGLNDAWLVKTNATGDTMWTKTYGGTEDDNSSCVRQTSDGGYIIFGETVSYSPNYWKAWLIKTDEDGDTSWTKRIGGNRHYFIQSGQELYDGDYIFVGYTKASGAGQEDLWLVKTNPSGDTIWTNTFGGNDSDISYSLDQTDDAGYVIGAITKSFGAGNYDCWLIKTDSEGDTIWTKTYGGINNDRIYSVQQTSDHGFILAGATQSYGILNSYYNLWLIKTDFSGDTIWTRTFGGVENELAKAVQQTSDGGYIVTGYSSSGTWIIKIDSSGDTLWTKTLGWGNGIHIEQTGDEGYIVLVEDFNNLTLNDMYLVKLTPELNDIKSPDSKSVPKTFILKQNYPNPFNSSTKIEFQIPKTTYVTVKIFNLLGEEVTTLLSALLLSGSYQYTWNASDLTTGIYFYKLTADNFVEVKKMLLVK